MSYSAAMWNLFVRKGKIYIPTQFKTESGFLLSGEPVFVSDLSDVEATTQSITRILGKGCQIIPTPPVGQLEKWAVLSHAKVRSIAAFEKGTSCWTIHKDHSSYRFGQVEKIMPRGWETEPKRPYFISNNLELYDIAAEIALRVSQAGDG